MVRLSWPGKSVVSRSFLVSMVMTMFLRASPLLLTNQIAPVIAAATVTDFTLFQRSSPPCAFTARSKRLLIKTPRLVGCFGFGKGFSVPNHGESYLLESCWQSLLIEPFFTDWPLIADGLLPAISSA